VSENLSAVSTGVTAGLFPGQGSQTANLREEVERVAPELIERCIELVGEDPFPRVQESTRFAQPAILCASIASWGRLRAHVRPVAFAGHSLGELSALAAAGALEPLTALELAVHRGELMASAAASAPDGMLALLGGTEEQAHRLAERNEVVLANDNAPGQIVLAGGLERLRVASLQARDQGMRSIFLDVAGAFHTPAMSDAVEPFRAALDRVELRAPAIPVISSSTARPFRDVRAELAAAIVLPVRWRETMLALAALGADTFIDAGPGHVLARLVARNLPDARVLGPGDIPLSRTPEASGVA